MNNPSSLYPKPKGLSSLFERMPQMSSALKLARAGAVETHQLLEAIPERLKRVVVSANASGAALTLIVNSAEAAHFARLLQSELLRNLSDRGLKFTEVQIRTQSEKPSPTVNRPRPGRDVGRNLKAVGENLSSERLQTSVSKLAKTLAGR